MFIKTDHLIQQQVK